jgi:CheY-like chemotaxis protein
MRVLVIDSSSHDADLALGWLQSAGHDVRAARDAKSAFVLLDAQDADVIVVDSQMTGMTFSQFLQRLRAREQVTRPYVVVVSSKPTHTELVAAISAGSDDYMRKSPQRDELVLRVGALDRIRGWAAKIFSCAAADSPGTASISRLEAWRTVNHSVTHDIAGLIGRSLVPDGDSDAIASSVLGARMPMTLPVEQTEVQLTVGVARDALVQLGEACLGDAAASEAAIQDVLRELANTAGGAFMRAAAEEGVALTCGLPVDLTTGSFATDRSPARQCFTVVTRDQSLRVAFEIAILSRALRRVCVTQLREGMVLARDLHTENGALLVPAGTRFTSSQIERMSHVLSPRITFDVAEAA